MRKLIFLILFMLPLGAKAQVMFASPSLATVTSSAAQVLPQNANRGYLIIINTGSGTEYVTFGTGLGNGIPIPAGGNYEPLKAPANSIFLRAPSGSFAVVEEGSGQ